MGRRYPYLWRQDSYIRLEESGDSGCIWGLLRLLNYHQHWQKVKKILPYKKHGTKTRLRNSSRDVGKQKGSNRLNEEERAVDGANPIPVERANPPDTGSVSKRSIKVRIRELMMAKEKNSKCGISYLPEQSIVETQTPNDGGKSAADADILEIFKVNKQIFLKMLNDHDLTRVNQSIKPGYWHSNGRLTKSGSFPCVNSTHMRDRGPSKLEDKQREIWPLTKSMPLLHENGSQFATSKGKLKSMRRASSLNESMDRYPQLFGSTFNKDIKRHLSRSLKLVISENDEPTPKFRRRLSLPESDYESFLPNLEAVNNSGPDGVEHSAAMNQAINEESSDFKQGDKVNEVAIDCDAQENQDLIPECPYREEQMSTIELAVSEDYKTSLVSQKADTPEAHKTDEILPFKLVDEKRNEELHYVNLVLELSGFVAKEQAWVWYTMEQPVNPAIFEQVEKQHYPLEQQKESKWGRKIIFDLINEALVEIDERSYLYYPRALSSSCHVHPIPKGGRLLEEVWVYVGRSLSWRPELDPTLDLAVAQDLLGRNGWMDLQIESECVALELEEMILDELLLDELLLACSSKSLQHSFIKLLCT